MTSQTISDIIRGMQYAVNTAEDMLASHQLSKLTETFNDDGTPKMRFVVLPNGKRIEISRLPVSPHPPIFLSGR